MKTIKINLYSELKNIKQLNDNEFTVNLEDCPMSQRNRIVDFLNGLTFLNGSMRKLNNHEFEIKIVK